MNAVISDEEIQQVSQILKRLELGLLPKDIFVQIARLMTTCTVVLISFFYEDDSLKVLLHQRSSEDLFYPNMYHPAGTILRASDESINDAFQRLYKDELGIPTMKMEPVFVNYVFDKIVRGREVSLIHWIELSKKPDLGDLFAVDSLPNNIIKNDVPRINMAVEHFLNHNNKIS